MKYPNVREETLKNKVAQDFFGNFDCTEIIKDIDFAVKINKRINPLVEDEYLLWAEAKKDRDDIFAMLTQLVLTIGKARTFDKILPPPFLGCFDCEKIAFVPYADIQDIFYQNDFNWKVAPSDHETREFKQVYAQIEKIINDIPWETYVFDFEKDEKELKKFIRDNFVIGKTETSKICIDKNNFITIYNKWLETVKPTIQVDDWTIAKKNGIMDGDFYLADLLSEENKTLIEKLSVLLKTDLYELNLKIPNITLTLFTRMGFSDNQKAHTQFWAKYKRPPLKEYWDYIIERRDLLVPQDVRERKGSFFTPKIWVELSQKYIADVLGKDWQDDYYVWDCAAGTGNLLAGLTNKYNIWASTLDKTDVDVMKERIRNGANLLESHVFQFDFLNDDFTTLPPGLQEIINNPEKRKKLVVYINPPYKRGLGVANTKWHKEEMGSAKDELFAQFVYRIYREIPGCTLAQFSKLKILQAPNFKDFRTIFLAKLDKMYICPADTFDNVDGKFPIGFFIWKTNDKEKFKKIHTDIYDEDGCFIGTKGIYCYDDEKMINVWLNKFSNNKKTSDTIGFINAKSSDFQHNNRVVIGLENILSKGDVHKIITKNNLIEMSIYFAVRKVIPATWLNDRDQFLFPNNKWKKDVEFQNDCLAYTLFSNNIQSKYGVNHWIPFTEYVVGARDNFESNFMTDFITGKNEVNMVEEPTLFYGRFSGKKDNNNDYKPQPHEFSETARKVFKAGGELWRYYHTVISSPCGGGREGAVNASLYDIREYFQKRNDKGVMNNKSEDKKYNELIENLRSALKTLAKKIEPKVYEYGFLKE